MNEREKYNKIILPDNLKHWREDLQLLQEDVAEKIGITVEEWQCMERGEKEISYSLLVNLCQKFEVSSDDILFYHKKSFIDTNPAFSMRELTEEEQEKIKLQTEEYFIHSDIDEP